MSNYNFSVDGVKYWDMGQGTALSDGKASMNSSKDVTEKLFSLFGRVNYAYKDTYMVSAHSSRRFVEVCQGQTVGAISGRFRRLAHLEREVHEEHQMD